MTKTTYVTVIDREKILQVDTIEALVMVTNYM